ncbi:pilus assembly protein [Loktanella sp. IMCC34160]|uniref:TadE/TadG family type IV pilus assembly protein n=1 Tax=Loktanella sp. IMCC34160 TaxID=2510646 RepID=UPI00101DB058|nr:TadE/TadG family type IV pilus assembly protein [Loktanella sp. IMCC34160]RYG93168.1 pilus assembly protein [Loktanella sp. IMCC34160]
MSDLEMKYVAASEWARRFRKEETGSATVEAVLWLPLFVVVFVMIADVSFVFHRQSQMMRIVQDANRAFSVGRLSSEAETENFVTDALAGLSESAVAVTTLNAGVISTSVQVPVTDMVAVGFFNFLSGYNVEVSSEHYLEY